MKRTAILCHSGGLAVAMLGIAAIAWGCDKPPATTGSSCSTSNVAVVAPAPCAASSPAQETPSAPAASPSPASAAAGMRASLDPETGVIGGPGALPPLTEEEAKLLLPEIQEAPVETVLPDGSVTVDLKGRGQEYFILQLDANGQRVVRCVQDPKAAPQTVPSSKPEER